MVSIHWIEKRKSHWDRLEQLVSRARHGLRTLNHAELQELGLLYRQTASDLAAALEDRSSAQLAVYLNQLLGRSHNLIYMGRRPGANAAAMSIVNDSTMNPTRACSAKTCADTSLAIAIFVIRHGGRMER